MKKDLKGRQALPDYYEELRQIIKAKSSKVTKKQTEMAKIFKALVKKHEAVGRSVFVKILKFYLDYLDKFDFGKILSAL